MVTRAIEQAQQKVESYNFDIRKHVVDYDDVMNTHRDVIYRERDKVLAGDSLRDTVLNMVSEEIDALGAEHLRNAPRDAETFRTTLDAMIDLVDGDLPLDDLEDGDVEELLNEAVRIAEERYETIETEQGEAAQRLVERYVLLQTIDTLWVQHLTAMEEMRQGIGLRAYGSSDPLVAYKAEAHDMWGQLLENIRSTVARQLFHARLVYQDAPPPVAPPAPLPSQLRESGPSETGEVAAATAQRQLLRKVGRNDLCPCGSGKKYKRCHGQNGA
jgi:preprotein translocase subunit SecA